MEMDFRPQSDASASRPHHRTTIITVSRKDFADYTTLRGDNGIQIHFVNDIVSSAMGGASVEHHMIRRLALLRRQFAGGYRKLKIRTEADNAIACEMLGLGQEADDACAGTVWIRKPQVAA